MPTPQLGLGFCGKSNFSVIRPSNFPGKTLKQNPTGSFLALTDSVRTDALLYFANVTTSFTVAVSMMTKSPEVDVVGVGLNATDTLIRLPHYPVLGSKIEVCSANVLPGGQVASAMVACQHWGMRTRYVGKLGDDSAAMLHRAEFARAGVEAQLITAPGSASQQAFILSMILVSAQFFGNVTPA